MIRKRLDAEAPDGQLLGYATESDHPGSWWVHKPDGRVWCVCSRAKARRLLGQLVEEASSTTTRERTDP